MQESCQEVGNRHKKFEHSRLKKIKNERGDKKNQVRGGEDGEKLD
jgi:hypothetical protein